MEKKSLIIACSFLAFGAMMNLIRFFWNIPISIGSICLPGWTGAIGFIALGALSIWSFRELYAFVSLANLLIRQKESVQHQPAEAPFPKQENSAGIPPE